MDELATKVDRLADRVDGLGRRIDALIVGRAGKAAYSTEEVALLVRRAPWTVREWCRHGRVRAAKRPGTDKWVITDDELRRLQAEGPLPGTP